MSSSKDKLHQLVEELPQSEVHAAESILAYLRDIGSDPFLRALALAPVDDEPTTPEEDEGASEAWQEYLRGEFRPWEEVREELAGG
ncbi:MAG TPA: hypothetical protein VK066_19005 [Chloroflexota bacterium]|nr:hypothetical protein [Chloroflexota bacterium]